MSFNFKLNFSTLKLFPKLVIWLFLSLLTSFTFAEKSFDQDQESIISGMLHNSATCSLSTFFKEKFIYPYWFMGYRGHCNGFVLLWLYSQYLQTVYPDKTDAYSSIWFKSTIADILGVNCPEIKNKDHKSFREIDNNCRMQNCDDLEKFAFTVDALQSVIGDLAIERAINGLNIDGQKLQKEYTITSLFTLDQLKQLLKQNIIHDHKLIYIMSPDHVIGLFKNKEDYRFYDPNDPKGESVLLTTDECAESIFAAHGFNVAKPSPVLIAIFSFDKKADSYPDSKIILDNIVPTLILINAKDYAEETVGLHLAAIWGCLECVEYFLNLGVDPDIANKRGDTPLALAIAQGHQAVIDRLLKAGASPTSALIDAIKNNDHKNTKTLLELGAEPNVADKEGKSALMYAAELGASNIVDILLAKGASIDAKDARDRTAIMHAAKNCHAELVASLIKQGADYKNHFVMLHAAKSGCSKVIEILLENNADPNSKGEGSETVLMLAAESGSFNAVRLLLEKGADPNIVHTTDYYILDYDVKNHQGMTALLYAVSDANEDNPEITELLLKHHANPNIVDRENTKTALMYAVEKGHIKITNALLNDGADPNAWGGYYRSPVIMHSDNIEIIKLLIAAGADPKIKMSNGETTLMHAINHGSLEIVKLFFENGIDLNAKTNDGETALMYAAQKGDVEKVNFLLANGADPHVQTVHGKNAIIYAAENKHPKIVEILLAKDPSASTKKAAIKLAAAKGNHEVLKILLDNEDHYNNEQSANLIAAVESGSLETVKILLSKEINPDATSDDSNTALMLAAQNGSLEMVQALLTKGAEPSIKNKNGWVAATFAFVNEHYEIVRVLEKAKRHKS